MKTWLIFNGDFSYPNPLSSSYMPMSPTLNTFYLDWSDFCFVLFPFKHTNMLD